MKHEPKMIPNPLYCEKCDGRGYLVADAEWEPYAVQCDACADRRFRDISASPRKAGQTLSHPYGRNMTNEKRELCKAIASHVGRKLPNGNLALRFKEGGHGCDEDVLTAIDLALGYYETFNHQIEKFR